MNTEGRRHYIEQGQVDPLNYRLFAEDGSEVTLSGTQYITVYDRGGTEVQEETSTGVSASTNVATYSRTWTAATFQRDHGYRAYWKLSDGSTTYYRSQYFSIVRRRFRPTLTDDDLTNLRPYITNQNQQADLSQYRLEAWERIEALCKARIPKPNPRGRGSAQRYRDPVTGGLVEDYVGNFFHPEDFHLTHKYMTCYVFMLHNSFGNDQNMGLAELYNSEASGQFELAMSRIDFDRDDDGLLDDRDEGFAFNSIQIDR